MKALWAVANTLFARTRKGPLRKPSGLQSQAGQALAELALMLPFLLLLALGVIELGRYAYISILIGNAARAGAAYGAQNAGTAIDNPGIVTAADNDFLHNGQDVNNLTVTSSTSCGCDTAGTLAVDYTTAAGCSDSTNPAVDTTISACVPPTGTGHWVGMVSVTASGKYNSLFSYPGIPGSISVSRTAVMRIE